MNMKSRHEPVLQRLPEEAEYELLYYEEMEKDRKKRKRRIVTGVIAAAALVVTAFVGSFAGGFIKSPYNNGNGTACINDTQVSIRMLQSVDRDREVTKIRFSNCVIDNEAIEKIGAMEKIENIEFFFCTGFSTLDPLAEIGSLKRLSLQGGEAVNMESWFTTEFTNLKNLSVVDYDLQQKTGFLYCFPGLETLELDGIRNCGDLAGLSVMKGLQSFSAFSTDLSMVDVHALTSCSELSFVCVSNSGIEDISSWKKLKNLKTVYLDNNGLTSVEGLRGSAEKLSFVQISGNQIDSLEVLSGAEQLKELYASDNCLSSLTGLEQSDNLQKIDASGNELTDIEPLRNHINLSQVYLGHNRITDLSPLSGCTEIWSIDVCDNRLTSLTGLESSLKLKNLSADSNEIRNLDGIRNAAVLEKVLLANNELEDISVLKKSADHAQIIWISNNHVSDISAFSQMSSLKYLLAEGNDISDLSSLSADAALEIVTLDNNQISDLSPLSGLDKLQCLTVSGNQIHDLTPLANMNSLHILDLSRNEIRDASPLSSLSPDKLALILCNNHITEIPELSPLTDYQLLSLYGNPVSDFSPIASVKSVWNKELDEKQPDHELIRKNIFVTWFDGMNPDHILYSELGYGPDWTTIVDCPDDKKIEIENRFKVHNNGTAVRLRFMTKEEADEELEKRRSQIFREENIRAGILNLADFIRTVSE